MWERTYAVTETKRCVEGAAGTRGADETIVEPHPGRIKFPGRIKCPGYTPSGKYSTSGEAPSLRGIQLSLDKPCGCCKIKPCDFYEKRAVWAGKNSMKIMMEEILESRSESPKWERELCLKLYSLAKKNEDRYAKTFAQTYLADAYQSMGFPFKAMKLCQWAIRSAQENGFESLLLILQNLLGVVYTDIDDEQGAMDCFLEGIRLAKEQGNDMMLSAQMANISYIYQTVGSYEKAKIALEESYHVFLNSSGNDFHVMMGEEFYRLQFAEILTKQDRVDDALAELNKITIGENNRYPADVWIAYAICYTQKQMTKEALCCLKRAEENLQKSENCLLQLSRDCNLIEVLLKLKEYKKAEEILTQAKALLDVTNLAGKRVKVAEYEIELYRATGETKKLQEAYRAFYKCDQIFDKERTAAQIKRVKRRIELQKEYERYAGMEARQFALENKNERDELTGIWNRRGLNRFMDEIMETAKKQQEPLTVIMVDVDFFKEYNDMYGHVAGDICLKKIAHTLKVAVKECGLSGRYGGDEFLLAVLAKKKCEVAEIIEGIQEEIRKQEIPNARSAVFPYVTVTIGAVNAVPKESDDVRHYVNAADYALYRIKKKTRNGYEITESLNPPEERETANE